MSGRTLPRGAAPLAASGVLLVACFAWTAYGLATVPAHPVLGWLPLPVMGLLASFGCWRVTRVEALGAATRRFWLHLTYACLLLTAGTVSNAFDALTGDKPSQVLGMPTLACYL